MMMQTDTAEEITMEDILKLQPENIEPFLIKETLEPVNNQEETQNIDKGEKGVNTEVEVNEVVLSDGTYAQYGYDGLGRMAFREEANYSLSEIWNKLKNEKGYTKTIQTTVNTNNGVGNAYGTEKEKTNNGNAYGNDKEKTNNGNAYGKDKEKTNNENAFGKEKNNGNNGQSNNSNGNGYGKYNNPGQGNKYGIYKHQGDPITFKPSDTEATRFMYIGLSNTLHKEYSSKGSPYAEYYQANGQVISQKMFGLHGKTTPGKEEALKTNGGMMYYHYNGQRSVTELTNRHGDKIEHYRYDAFGNIQTGITAPYNTVSYTGQRYDDKTGLINMNARWYNANTGRFTTEDTWMGDLFNPQSLNKYSYVMNNPVNMWDPIGNVPDWVKEQKTHLEFYETGGQIEYAYYFQKYDTGSNGLERIGEQDYGNRIEYYYEEQVYHNWLYSVVYCYNYREVEEEFGNIVWDFDKEETNKIYSETDYYYETITKYADEIANDVLQKIQQLVGNPPSNTGKPAFTIEKLNGEIINTEIAILGTRKNLSDSEKTAVKVVQLKLNEVINAGLAVDGSYGPLTTGAAQYFQKVLKLPANGVMDTKTFTQLQYYYEYLTNEQISYVEREDDRHMFGMVTPGMGENELIWPTRSTRVSDYVRMRDKHPITGEPRMHRGIDIGAYLYGIEGDIIVAAADGVVSQIGYQEGKTGAGHYISINSEINGKQILTRYFHLQKDSTTVEVGNIVYSGQEIAKMESTGGSTVAHLHFEIWESTNGKKVKIDRSNAQFIEPLDYFPQYDIR